MSKSTQSLFGLAALLFASPVLAALNVFACEPEWGALARELAGDAASVSQRKIACCQRSRNAWLRAS